MPLLTLLMIINAIPVIFIGVSEVYVKLVDPDLGQGSYTWAYAYVEGYVKASPPSDGTIYNPSFENAAGTSKGVAFLVIPDNDFYDGSYPDSFDSAVARTYVLVLLSNDGLVFDSYAIADIHAPPCSAQ